MKLDTLLWQSFEAWNWPKAACELMTVQKESRVFVFAGLVTAGVLTRTKKKSRIASSCYALER